MPPITITLPRTSTITLSRAPNGGTPYDVAALHLTPDGIVTLDVTTRYGGDATPIELAYDRTLCYDLVEGVAELDVEAIRTALTTEPAASLLTRIIDGYDVDWTHGPSTRLQGTLTDDAQDAHEALETLLEELDCTAETAVWDTATWMHGAGSRPDVWCRTPSASAEEYDTNAEQEAQDDGIALSGEDPSDILVGRIAEVMCEAVKYTSDEDPELHTAKTEQMDTCPRWALDAALASDVIQTLSPQDRQRLRLFVESL